VWVINWKDHPFKINPTHQWLKVPKVHFQATFSANLYFILFVFTVKRKSRKKKNKESSKNSSFGSNSSVSLSSKALKVNVSRRVYFTII